MDIILVFKQMIILFILMITGYIAKKRNIMNEESDKLFSKLIVNITCPALIIYSVASGERLEDKSMLIYIFVVAIIYYVSIPIISKILMKILKIKKSVQGLYESMLIYSNLGFMGIPVVSSIFGNRAILYISIIMSVCNISLFTYGIFLLTKNNGNTGKQTTDIKKFFNAGTISAIIAIGLYIMNISLPEIILEPLKLAGNLTTPLAMLVIGSTLVKFSFKEIIKEKWISIFAIIRLFVLAIIIWYIGHIFINDKLLLGVLVIISGMPVASNIVMMCSEYGGNQEFITKGVFISTLFSVVTIPIIAMLL
ncbi:hypothetical protein DZE40_004333 [Clostridium beijerinckii]|uniref:AEC family transporter n=2 Tax=Clostridium beijerinckii TaxID=1520 RepID=UPI001570ED57|nr:AEC family transporter [Clostridium beijerinckii]NRY63238.1 hypothetical protein [Clostridium beijerinckii]